MDFSYYSLGSDKALDLYKSPAMLEISQIKISLFEFVKYGAYGEKP